MGGTNPHRMFSCLHSWYGGYQVATVEGPRYDGGYQVASCGIARVEVHGGGASKELEYKSVPRSAAGIPSAGCNFQFRLSVKQSYGVRDWCRTHFTDGPRRLELREIICQSKVAPQGRPSTFPRFRTRRPEDRPGTGGAAVSSVRPQGWA